MQSLLLKKAVITALMGTSMAAPLIESVEKRSIAQNTQSCVATNYGVFNHYKIVIGAPYDKKYCDASSDRLYNNPVEEVISVYGCESIENGSKEMNFNYPFYQAGHINEALEHAFPSVNGFNCPDY